MALPDAVKKQVEAGEKAHEEVYGEKPPETPTMEIVDAPPPGETPPEETPPAAETPPEETPPKEEEPEQPPVPAVSEEKWEARYKALQGKYNAEIPRLNDKNKELQERLDGLEQTLATLQQNPAPAQPAQGELTIDQEFIDEYGEGVAAMLQTLQGQVASLTQANKTLQQQVDGVTTQTEGEWQARLTSTLDAQVEGWRKQNDDPDFLVWLGQTDAYTGKQRQQLLDEAFEGLNTDAIVAIFKGYKQENAGLTPPSEETPAPQPPVSKETLVAPGAAGSGSDRAPEGSEKHTWTQAQIQAFYNDVTAGRYKGREADKLATEQDIVAAGREGRIIG